MIRLKGGAVNKYGAKKCIINGEVFHSMGEAKRYMDLQRMQQAKLIMNLRRQVVFKLEVLGQLICKKIIDFTYDDLTDGVKVAEDFKGYMTKDEKIKLKLFQAIHKDYVLRITR